MSSPETTNGLEINFNIPNVGSLKENFGCTTPAMPTPTNGSMKNPGMPIGSPDHDRKSSLRRNISYGTIPADRTEAKVMVIYTGGTIGMMRNELNYKDSNKRPCVDCVTQTLPSGEKPKCEHGSSKKLLEPIPNALIRKIRKYPNMHDEEYAAKRYGGGASMGPLVLPQVPNVPRRVIYTVTEYDPLLASSNMTINEWARLAEDIKQSYEFFDGFVILHGTDTLSYTASALSFMLENLGKTVIITGSQIPIFETRTDGKDNFTTALILAGNYVIPEVCVLFGSKLMRGNRTIKASSEFLEAFDSPNAAPIAKIGINIEVDYRTIFRPCTVSKFEVFLNLDENVGVLRIFPSISVSTIKAFLQPPMKGVVIQSYGCGNVPSNRGDLLKELKEASDRGVIIVNCTQCTTGSVSEVYETGHILHQCGVISGCDMTPEAALAKLSYVLGKSDWTLDYKKKMMQSSLRGELTSARTHNMEEYDLVDAVARSLHLSSRKELEQLGATLFPAMVNTAVISQDIQKINNLKSYGADLSAVNYDHRTALHVACSEGNEDVVKHLLISGVSVHIKDRHDRTPLTEAIVLDNHNIIKILVKCGAHLTGSSRRIGEHLCCAAARGFLKRIISYQLAGVDLSQPDYSGRTALHVAALHGHVDIVKYLLKNFVETDDNDLLGLSPLDYAKRGGNPDIINLLENSVPVDA